MTSAPGERLPSRRGRPLYGADRPGDLPDDRPHADRGANAAPRGTGARPNRPDPRDSLHLPVGRKDRRGRRYPERPLRAGLPRRRRLPRLLAGGTPHPRDHRRHRGENGGGRNPFDGAIVVGEALARDLPASSSTTPPSPTASGRGRGHEKLALIAPPTRGRGSLPR